MKRTLVVLLVLVVLASATVFAQGVQEAKKPYIAVVSKGEQHDFWQQVKLGANAAAAYGVISPSKVLLLKVMCKSRWKC